MAFEVPDHYHLAFTSNVELLLQQEDSRFAACVTTDTYKGKKAQVVRQFGEVEFQEKNSRLSDTNFSEIEHRQRWIYPRHWDNALPIEDEDEIQMLDSPVSPYAQAQAAGWNRKKDSLVISAATGSAKTGVEGGTTTPFDTTNFRVAVDFTISGAPLTSGLTTEKVTEAKRMLDASECPANDRYFGASSYQLQDLLNSNKVGSNDYNTVKALVNGEVDTWVGFKFVRSEMLGVSSSVRSCLAWHKTGLHLGMWGGLFTRIGERPDKKYLTQVFMKGTMNATRTNEEKVVEVLCSEA